MRITCPNCGAQYEVSAGVIPAVGRDVQCSACAHTWFETGKSEPAVPVQVNPVGAAPEDALHSSDEHISETSAPPSAVQEQAGTPDPVKEPAPRPDKDARSAPAQSQSRATDERGSLEARPVEARPALSPEVAAILREEADREKAARDAARPVIETQTELGLDTHVDPETRRAEEARRRMARLRGEEAPPTKAPPQSEPGTPPPARARLPDIEEINSTLRAASERAPAGVIPAEPIDDGVARGRGFRIGFFLVLLVVVLGAVVYLTAPRLAASLPALSGPLDRYVAGVDDTRLWLDLKLQSLIPAPADNAATDPDSAVSVVGADVPALTAPAAQEN